MPESRSHRFAVPVYRLRLVRERVLHYAVEHCGSAHHAAQILHAELDDSDRERVVVIAVNGRNVPVGVETVAVGGLHGCGVAPRDVLKTVLQPAALWIGTTRLIDNVVLGEDPPPRVATRPGRRQASTDLPPL